MYTPGSSCSMDPTGGGPISQLWAFLRAHGLQHLAVDLVRHRVHSVESIAHNASQLVEAGMREADVSQLLECIQPSRSQNPRGRSDLPPIRPNGQRASFTLALVAAEPNNRKRSLEDLDRDILARSTEPAQVSRLRTYRAICSAWGIAAFPLSVENIRCCAASLKAGRYRSASLYLQAAVNHQLRFLREPVHPLLRSTIKDVVRSIKRGLGPSRLKEGFDVFALTSIVDVDDDSPFDFRRPSHLVDVCILGCWYMLREIELAGAYRQHLTIEADEVRLLIPVHKTATSGTLTQRSLRCPCSTIIHRLCPWHAAERHLIRLNGMKVQSTSVFPLMPDSNGQVISKATFVEALRDLLTLAGVSVWMEVDEGHRLSRFGGHALRVSGAMMLANAQVPLYLIQLLQRWSSSAVERYVQCAPLTTVPSVPTGVLSGQDIGLPSALMSSSATTPSATPNPGTPGMVVQQQVVQPSTQDDRVPGIQGQMDKMQKELQAMKSLISTPEVTLVVRPRSRVVHLATVDEQSNMPQVWQTKCGWSYGCSRFFRIPCIEERFSKCKKCFAVDAGQQDPADSDGSSRPAISSSDSSSSDSTS